MHANLRLQNLIVHRRRRIMRAPRWIDKLVKAVVN